MLMKLVMLIFRNLRTQYRPIAAHLSWRYGTCVCRYVDWSILSFLNNATSEKSQNFKGIVSERWSIPSQMPFTYAQALSEGAAREEDDVKPQDSMTWQFFGGSTDTRIAISTIRFLRSRWTHPNC